MGRWIKKQEQPHRHDTPPNSSNVIIGDIWECECGTRLKYTLHLNVPGGVELPRWEVDFSTYTIDDVSSFTSKDELNSAMRIANRRRRK